MIVYIYVNLLVSVECSILCFDVFSARTRYYKSWIYHDLYIYSVAWSRYYTAKFNQLKVYIYIYFYFFLELILKRTMVNVNYMNCLLQDRTGKHWLGFCARFVSARMYFVSACLSCKCLTYIRPMFQALGSLFVNASLPCFGENLRSRFCRK